MKATLPFLLLLLLIAAPPAEAEIQIVLRRHDEPGTHDRFEVTGLAPQTFSGRRSAADLFAVHVDEDSVAGTPLFGDFRFSEGKLVFEPRFDLQGGVRYRAIVRPPGSDPIERRFQIPKPRRRPSARVRQVFPTRDALPENQLKFYLHFSEPMSRGDVYQHIRLYKQSDGQPEAGEQIEYPFLELDQELWDRTGKRFTLFFDPGRVKRGLRPREELGPALEEGGQYRLAISKQWLDARGQPMRSSFVKDFRVVPPDYIQPHPDRWKLAIPTAGTLEPLTIKADESLDHAMLQRVITVVDDQDRRLSGTIEVDQHETRLVFRPDSPWKIGQYALAIETTLEDLAGNSIARPFEVDMFREVQSRIEIDEHRVPFRVQKGS